MITKALQLQLITMVFALLAFVPSFSKASYSISQGEGNIPRNGRCAQLQPSGCWGLSCDHFYKDLSDLKIAMSTCESNPAFFASILRPIKERSTDAQKIIGYSTADTLEQRKARERALKENRKARNAEIDMLNSNGKEIENLVSLFRETIYPRLNTSKEDSEAISRWCAKAKAQVPDLVALLNNGIPRRISEQHKNGTMLCIQNEARQQQEIARVHRIYSDFLNATHLNSSSEVVVSEKLRQQYQDESPVAKPKWTLMRWWKDKREERRARKQQSH